MPQDGYEARFRFDSPAAMGEGIDVAIRAIIEAGIPMQMVQPDWVAIEGGEARALTDAEDAAVDAGMEQNSPTAGTMSIELEDEDEDDE